MPQAAPFRPFYRLRGRVMHYPWGGYSCIPGLLGVDNKEKRPFAELWLGSHPQAPSEVEWEGGRIGLDELLRREGERILGRSGHAHSGAGLPFLFKVLDAREMLSIQVHPSRGQAEAGYAAEEAAGVPLSAPQRNYKDRNHKPEVHVALSEFWMLHGFRPLEEIADVLAGIPDFTGLAPWFPLHLLEVDEDPAGRAELLRHLYAFIMTMPQEEVDRILQGLLDHLIPLYDAGSLEKSSPHYWAVKAARSFPLPEGHFDRGIFSIYLLNLVELQPGEGTFQGAGVPHAYLEGINVELMANSDNVLRGGLTPKHVDVPELLKTLRFADGRPEILTGVPAEGGERLYPAPVDDFLLSRIELKPGRVQESGNGHGPDILILLEGEAVMEAEGEEFALLRGAAVLAAAGVPWRLQSGAGALLYRATVPLG